MVGDDELTPAGAHLSPDRPLPEPAVVLEPVIPPERIQLTWRQSIVLWGFKRAARFALGGREMNFNTTKVGIATFVAALGAQLVKLWDGDPTTVPDWGVLVSAVLVMIGFYKTADAK